MINTKNQELLLTIVKYINQYNGIDIRNKTRERHYVFCRVVYFKLANRFVPDTLTSIAASVGLHHATAIHCRKLFDEVYTYSKYKKMYDDASEYMTFLIESDNIKEASDPQIYKSEEYIDIDILMGRINSMEVLLNKKNNLISFQRSLIDSHELEPHEVLYRELPSEKRYIFKERVDAILRMI